MPSYTIVTFSFARSVVFYFRWGSATCPSTLLYLGQIVIAQSTISDREEGFLCLANNPTPSNTKVEKPELGTKLVNVYGKDGVPCTACATTPSLPSPTPQSARPNGPRSTRVSWHPTPSSPATTSALTTPRQPRSCKASRTSLPRSPKCLLTKMLTSPSLQSPAQCALFKKKCFFFLWTLVTCTY